MDRILGVDSVGSRLNRILGVNSGGSRIDRILVADSVGSEVDGKKKIQSAEVVTEEMVNVPVKGNFEQNGQNQLGSAASQNLKLILHSAGKMKRERERNENSENCTFAHNSIQP